MTKEEAQNMPVEAGSVVQINPSANTRFGACFAIVEEVRDWGLIAYVIGPKHPTSAKYPICITYDHCEFIGTAEWMMV